MDIYCGKCNQNIGLQTNEEFNEMHAKTKKLENQIKELKEELSDTRQLYYKVVEQRNKLLKGDKE